MILVIWRLFLRIVFLVLIVWSIFYFFVFWYRYNPKGSFNYKTAWIYEIKAFSNSNYIFLDNEKFFLVDNKITLYSIPELSCKKLKIDEFEKFICFDWKQFNKILYISPKILKMTPFEGFFSKLDLKCNNLWDCSFTVNNIDFFISKDWTIFYKDDISTKKLTNLPNSMIIGYVEDGLIFEKNWKLFKLKYKK